MTRRSNERRVGPRRFIGQLFTSGFILTVTEITMTLFSPCLLYNHTKTCDKLSFDSTIITCERTRVYNYNITQFHHDWNIKLIAQFFATVLVEGAILDVCTG